MLWDRDFEPASEYWKNALFDAMKEAGYKWDAEKKELKKIDNKEYNDEDYGIDGLFHAQIILENTLGKVAGYQSDDGILEHECAISAVKKLYEQKSIEWSKEDEDMRDTIIRDLKRLGGDIVNIKPAYKAEIDWLKSLKDRVQPKQEWSEEDEKKLNRIYTLLAEAADKHAFSTTCRLIGDKECVELQDFLRSLRPQPKQEWSEKDTEILNGIANYLFTSTDVSNVEGSDEWYDWLKSLKNRVQKSF